MILYIKISNNNWFIFVEFELIYMVMFEIINLIMVKFFLGLDLQIFGFLLVKLS